MSTIGTGAGGGAVMRVSRMPTPSIRACGAWRQGRRAGHQRRQTGDPAERAFFREEKAGRVRAALKQGPASTNTPARAFGPSHPRTSSTPPNAADLAADRMPVRSCRKPPVSAPEAMLFQGSSFFRSATSVQSKVEKRPPHTAKLPPIFGASRLIACGSHRERKNTRGRVAPGTGGLPATWAAVPACRPRGLYSARTSTPPLSRAPPGLFFRPLSRCHSPPPTAPMPKAPPMSSNILQAAKRRSGQPADAEARTYDATSRASAWPTRGAPHRSGQGSCKRAGGGFSGKNSRRRVRRPSARMPSYTERHASPCHDQR